MSQALAHMLDQLLRRDADAGPKNHERLWHLAPLGIGNSNHRGLQHGCVAHDRLLNLDRGNVLAA